MNMHNFAYLKETSPFYRLFPRGCVPIQNSLVASQAVMEGDNQNQPQDFYRCDVKLLTPEQISAIAQMVAEQCSGTPDQVAAHMRKEGFIPLRAIHVRSVSSNSRAFL